MQYITLENVTAFFVGVGYFIAFLKWIAPKTSSKIDDDIVSGIESSKKFAFEMSPYFWAIIEQMEKSGKIQKLNKPVEFLLLLRKAYKDSFGKELPEQAESIAHNVAAGISAQVKIPVNPLPAQVSPLA